MDDANLIKLGPVGFRSRNQWDDKGKTKIVQIFISHDKQINSLQFQYVENGKLVLSDRHGENNGCKFDAVKFNYPSEYITWISCHLSSRDNFISSITFGTNCGEYGPFGQSNATDKLFCFRLGDHQFGGFYGTYISSCVTSIGVYVKPITTLDSLSNRISFPLDD